MKKEPFRNIVMFIPVLFIVFCLVPGQEVLSAPKDTARDSLRKVIVESKTNAQRLKAFEDLKYEYFRDGRYSEFVQFLKDSFQANKELLPFVQYYTALARYEQLDYLEKEKKWEEYFEKGNTLKEEMLSNAQKAIDATNALDPVHVYSRLLIWRYHRGQQDAASQQSLEELTQALSEYEKGAQDLRPLKDVADVFQSFGDKIKAEDLYRRYAEKLALVKGGVDELKTFADSVYSGGNPEFAQVLYDVYIEQALKTAPLDKLIAELRRIAGLFFADKDALDYVVKIYDKIEEIGGKNVFDESMILQRAFVLLRTKAYLKAKDIYEEFIKKYPCSSHYSKALFKVGIIYTYVLRNTDKGRLCFEQVVQKKDSVSLKECGVETEKTDPWLISSLYQLGLLSQWGQDVTKAKEYYTQLTEKAKGGFDDSVELTQQRLKEIEEGNQMEYGLKLFLDVSLKPENERYDMSRLDLTSSVVYAKKKVPEEIYSNYYITDTGSMQPAVQYFWSGHIGTAKPSFEDSEFSTSYDYSGTKEINLVVVSSQGVIDRGIYLEDVQE